MARVVLTTAQVSSVTDELVRPLVDAGHELAQLPAAQTASEDTLIGALAGASGVIAGVEKYTARLFDATPDLRVIARTGVGYDAIDVEAATAHGVFVTTTPGANHHSVAEAAIGMIVATLRRFAFADHQMRTTGWNPRPYGTELRGKTVGVVGTGLVGREVIRRLQGWDVTIVASDVVKDEAFAAQHNTRYVELSELFATSDAVTVHAPLFPSTFHMVNEATLRSMKPSAILVNTARGPLVDEAALAQALQEGWIAGAALDVFETEPLASDSPLIGLSNVMLTQHVAGVTWESMRAMTAMAVDSVAAILRGETPPTIVNKEAIR
jgi:D-3-phosphoglycerate dehydrogenase